ncbi:MAG TPA: hypothetical protein VMS12_01680 [Thermoanaerobaculia bacterium]|nr:hypothetical protein [Thermoanaerobaculia bacterium]
MSEALAHYLAQRPESSGLLSPVDLPRALAELFDDGTGILPEPYKIFFVDESLPPALGFPVRDSSVLRELDVKLEQWMTLEVQWQLSRDSSKKAVDQALSAYLAHLVRVTENAMLSNLLADYHAIFWLAHSLQLSRHFSSLKKKIIALDTEAGRNRGDQLRFRVFLRWSVDVREQMSQLATRNAGVLEGEEERALQFFRLIQENVIILTEEFISPDLRELRSFLAGYLNQNYFHFRDTFEKIRGSANQLLQSDRVFRGALEMFAGSKVNEITTGLLLDSRFQNFLFEHPAIEQQLRSEERELIRSISRRLGQFAVLQELRRGIHWMTSGEDEEIVSTDRRQEVRYAKTTRPIDFGHSGVVDPMVHRFGLMYDITSFSETLGNIARGGVKGELGSYRQMLLFQRRLDTIATRHNLQLEKFLGDGAFYTTRTVIPLVRAAVEIQRYYDELRRKGFAFDRGLRIALNYGYYRLLPMRGRPTSGDRSMEFYGPGVVELSRLTTGKAIKDVEEIETYLISHGYDLASVQKFFSPLTSGASGTTRSTDQRSFHAEVDGNGHLVNEGIVASFPFLEELSSELISESQQLFRLKMPWASYIGFRPDVEQVPFVGIRLIGTVSLKGMEKLEVAEMIRLGEDQAVATPIEQSGSLIGLLRQAFHAGEDASDEDGNESTPAPGRSRGKVLELVLCSKDERAASEQGILIGEWDPRSDEICNSIQIPKADLEGLLGTNGSLTQEKLEEHRAILQRIYRTMKSTSDQPPVRLDSLRRKCDYVAFILGERSRTEDSEGAT